MITKKGKRWSIKKGIQIKVVVQKFEAVNKRLFDHTINILRIRSLNHKITQKSSYYTLSEQY